MSHAFLKIFLGAVLISCCGQKEPFSHEENKTDRGSLIDAADTADIKTGTATGTDPDPGYFSHYDAWKTVPDTCVLEGFFKRQKRVIWDEPVTCDAFVVKGGTEELLHYLNALVDNGNTVNMRDDDGRLVVILELDDLGEEVISNIKTSSQEHTVRLIVKAKEPEGKCADACYSFLVILDAFE